MIRHAASIKEDHAEHGEPASHQRIVQHHSAMVLIAYDTPIVLYLLDAPANPLAAHAEDTVLDRGGQTEEHRPDQLGLRIDVVLAEQGIRTGRHQHKGQNSEAHKDHCRREQFLHPR